VAYACHAVRFLFELRESRELARFGSAPLRDAHATAIAWRDATVRRLTDADSDAGPIESAVIGRRPGARETVPQSQRVRLIPLPSVGHTYTDPSIRRLLIEVPHGCPIPADDVRWAFSGLEVGSTILVQSDDETMLRRSYAASGERWHTITPAALPAVRRRIDPARRTAEAKGHPERAAEEASAVAAVRQALRHAAIDARPLHIEVQREPWRGHWLRAESFAAGTRFPKERLWHVRLRFDRNVAGPLVLGDGRYVGLGVMVRDGDASTHRAWRIGDDLAPGADPMQVARDLRRAVMARVQQQLGRRALPPKVSGHRDDGTPAAGHDHLQYIADLERSRLIVIDPRPDPHVPVWRALDGFTELRAGRAGLLRLHPIAIDSDDPLMRSACAWRSVTPYRVDRHARRASAHDAIADDIRSACQQMELPSPASIAVDAVQARSGSGLEAMATLRFATPVQGPLLLGRTRHIGGGVFEAVAEAKFQPHT
jgi:CRISPR-associated protein Csb2